MLRPGAGKGLVPDRKTAAPLYDAERRDCASVRRFMLHEADRGEWADALERGRIVHFAKAPVPLPTRDEQELLRDGLAPWLRRKNVSYSPEADRLTGMEAPPAILARAHAILRAHSARVRGFLQREMPEFTRGWTPGTSSFRPMEEQGRDLSAHASNELIHVDAGAYGATHGDRILRFFINLNPAVDRVWISRGAFAELLEKHGREAEVERGPLDASLPERLYGGVLRAAGR